MSRPLIKGQGKTMKGEELMLNHNALQTELLNDNFDRIGGMVMQTFKKIIDFIKKALGEAHYKNGSYRFGDKQYDPIFENSESYFYMEQLIKKYKPAE